MKKAIHITAAVMLLTTNAASGQETAFTETFEDYPPTILTRNATEAFGQWRTVLMDGRSEIGPAAAGAVADNPTQTLRFSTVGTDRASAINDELSFTEGTITLDFDFIIERSTGSNTFFLANSTNSANAGAPTTLFRLTIIDQQNDRYRIGTAAATNAFSGTSTTQTLAYGEWYRFQSTVDLNQGLFHWQILDRDGEPTRIRADDLAVNAESPRALESLWFGKVGAAQDIAGAIDNISIGAEAAGADEPD